MVKESLGSPKFSGRGILGERHSRGAGFPWRGIPLARNSPDRSQRRLGAAAQHSDTLGHRLQSAGSGEDIGPSTHMMSQVPNVRSSP